MGIANVLCLSRESMFVWAWKLRGGGWGGVGGMINVPCSCTHVGCYATATSLACAHMLGATSMLGGGVFFFCRVEMVDSREYYIYYVV